MRRLWQMLAHNNGQTINLSIIGSSLGISHTTVRNYLDLLQETFMVYLLPPLLTNQGKRLIKTPKVYITDSGIVAGLLGLRDFNALVGHQVFGSLWEGIVLMNIKGVYPQAELFFYRTTNGAEIDIIMELGNKRFALECKASLAPTVTKGTYIALGDLAPLHTFVVAPVQEGYLLKPNMSVVSLSELFCRLSAFLAD
jgi:predicted AAA+ superfamily ATPase